MGEYVPETGWMSQGNCVGSNLDFIDNKSPSKTKALKAICNGTVPGQKGRECPVRLECFWFAVDTDASGVWGGVAKPERDLMQYWLPRKDRNGVVIQAPLFDLVAPVSNVDLPTPSLEFSHSDTLRNL